jgi:hypothetical protein
MGDEIDAHDIVVRMKAYWLHGAENCGTKLSVWATYPDLHAGVTPPSEPDELWITHCPGQIRRAGREEGLVDIRRRHLGSNAMQLEDTDWHACFARLGKHPSTGFVTGAMAIRSYPTCELSLYGFDSTTPDRDDFWDARRPYGGGDERTALHHGIMNEKRELAKIAQGLWLGEPCEVTLNWPCKPGRV